MMATDPDLRVEVVDDEIVVTLAGSSYSVTYYKSNTSQRLIAKRMSDKEDARSPMTLYGFLAAAWCAANDNARELGWIA
jgi:hypothetical protein